ncbi:TRPC2 protein, partial [Rhodinocichla rosea]|nr:TRPC2 protein [Rhodinocichla rosea]
LQLTCSQSFSPCSCFGLSFICLHKPQGQEPDPPQPPLDTEDAELSDRAWCSSPAFHRTFFPESCITWRSREEKQLRSRLWKLEGDAWNPAHLSHSAWMELLTAQNQNQALRPRAG